MLCSIYFFYDTEIEYSVHTDYLHTCLNLKKKSNDTCIVHTYICIETAPSDIKLSSFRFPTTYIRYIDKEYI